MVYSTTSVTCGAGTATPSEAPEFTPIFNWDRGFSFCPFPFGHCGFDLLIFTASGYHSDIFKRF
jgi:hypothetical protein